jgi:REP element-mobilizing transposase RayT
MKIREKSHRLSKEFYKGEVSIAFTLCMKDSAQAFKDNAIVAVFTEMLASTTFKQDCIIPVYCFMPNHQHLIVTGKKINSDIWKLIVNYKQKTGFWMSKNKIGIKWQKDFYDHIIRTRKDLSQQVKYVLNNPVRKGLVTSWEEYPFKGSIGCDLKNVLSIKRVYLEQNAG